MEGIVTLSTPSARRTYNPSWDGTVIEGATARSRPNSDKVTPAIISISLGRIGPQYTSLLFILLKIDILFDTAAQWARLCRFFHKSKVFPRPRCQLNFMVSIVIAL
jgi:hypothetical protein